MLKKIKIFDKKIQIKYPVFKNLREKGYIVKTALKFGAEFRVYEKNNKHAKYLTLITTQKSKINLKDFVKRYKETMETSLDANYQQKLLDLIEIKFKEWNFDLDEVLISGVKKWELQ